MISVPTRTLRSSSELNLVIPSTVRKYGGDQAFAVAGPKLWNELPEELKLSRTLIPFQKS